MEYRRLGSSGLKVSVLSLGAMTFGESKTFMKGVTSTDDQARRVFDAALEDGVNLVDTANVYGDGASERMVGAWIKGKRDRVLVATKCRFPFDMGLRQPGPHDQGLSRKHIMEACEASLRRLDVETIDLYQVHMQDRSVGIEETLRALDDLVSQGKVRYIGCSNYTGYRLVEALSVAERRRTVRYESVQLQWSLIVRGAEREVIPACEAFGVGVMVWSPLARGFLSGKYQKGMAPPPGCRLEQWKESFQLLDQPPNWRILDKVQQLAALHETTPAAVALAWLLAKNAVSTIIVGARTVEQWKDNRRALDLVLTAEQVRALDEISAPPWGYPYDFIGSREPW
ncbi:MAG TPA: aldo/keto reductase [Polyangiaceae bacterium]|jgi:aryl-alcohol dehydrogenase-like predicted oxidoreductase|nr:MAG: L-glyceraldehyde 3-phosphate reductase [Deltaproteobacteria bacterium ADurb.Bin207]HNZ22681.1 aldo/keto reductase [Polyangiaceae bacterium]HOD21575.1 aldo/keto reductase [Polyangiaceae bacterium]HOE49275.1 aldo/keto reductase [Polyangiaceae bacterium]HOH00350.1 aldo/keto reductase [Polyangiaceae bacterium]